MQAVMGFGTATLLAMLAPASPFAGYLARIRPTTDAPMPALVVPPYTG